MEAKSEFNDLNLKEIIILSENNILFHYSNNSSTLKIEDKIKIYLNIFNLLQNITNKKDNKEISFNQLFFENEKIIFVNVKKNNLLIIVTFQNKTKNPLIKLFILHFIISFINFLNEANDLDNKAFNSLNKMIKRKIYEKYLFLPMKEHFEIISSQFLEKQKSNQSNIIYKGLYVIELESSKIIFSKSKIDKISNYYTLYKEILYHINNLKNSYTQKFSNRFELNQDYFVKLEYTSTYPRLMFIIKFIPVLKGIALIHIYSQNKLSRNENKVYKEFDIIYGNDINKENNHIELKFNEPKIHKEIEMFFIEFFISINSSFDLFYHPKVDLKYFNFDILMLINNVLSEEKKKNNNNLELIMNSLTNILYEEFLLSKDNENKKKEEMTTKYLNNKGDCDLNILPLKEEKTQTFYNIDSTLKKTEMMFSNYQWNNLSSNQNLNPFLISKNFCFKILFDDLKKNFNPNEITLNLTYFDEKSNNNSKIEKLSEMIMKDNSYSYLKKSIRESSIYLEKKKYLKDFRNLRGKSFDIKINNNINKGKFIEQEQENKSFILPKKINNDIFNKEENENTKLLKDFNENNAIGDDLKHK